MEEMTKIYLNNAATSWPKPKCVADAVYQAVVNMPGAANRGGIESFDVFHEVRKGLAKRIGVEAYDCIALGNNSSWALNLGIFGMDLQVGDTVVSSKSEHNSVLRPLYALEQKGVQVIYVDADRGGRIVEEKWRQALETHRPKLAVFTHASNVTGAVNDAEKLTAYAKQVGAAVLLDASQSCGMIEIKADKWGVDMVAVTGHKYLLGPQGTGALYVRPGLELKPHMLGGTGKLSDLRTMPEEMPLRLEAGTGNEPSFHGLLAAMNWADENPVDKADLDKQMDYVKNELRAMGVELVESEGECTPVLSFSVKGKAPEDVAFILAEGYDIVCRSGLHCAPMILDCIGYPRGTVRLSLSRFTTKEELDEFIQAMRDVVDDI